jgi:hypothetical protein
MHEDETSSLELETELPAGGEGLTSPAALAASARAELVCERLWLTLESREDRHRAHASCHRSAFVMWQTNKTPHHAGFLTARACASVQMALNVACSRC